MVTTDQRDRRRRMGARIKNARLDLGLSQEQVAVLVVRELKDEETLDQSMISRYETGNAVPEPPKRRALERVLHLKPGELQHLLEPEAANTAMDNLVVADRATHDRLSSLEEDMRAVKSDVAEIRAGVARLLKDRRGSGAAR